MDVQAIKLCPGALGAAARNDVSYFQSLSTAHADSIHAKDAFGRAAFTHAAKGDCWAVLHELLAHPGWINWADACCDVSHCVCTASTENLTLLCVVISVLMKHLSSDTAACCDVIHSVCTASA